jgi:hypothetical protein
MRRWFVLLLIALLPLRAWVGEAMAGEMLAQQAVGAHAQADPVPHGMHAAAKAAAHDCMEGHAAPAHHDSVPLAHGQDDCPTCAACQVCSSVALNLEPPRLPTTAAPHALPANGPARFASALAARAVEPPIS